jgi:hypothetical protein
MNIICNTLATDVYFTISLKYGFIILATPTSPYGGIFESPIASHIEI